MKRILFLIPFILLVSCNPYKKVVYLRDIEQKDTLWPRTRNDYHLQPADILYVRIVSPNPDINAMYNPIFGNTMNMSYINQGGMYLFGYTVSDSGYVQIPFLGNIAVAGKTLPEAEMAIQQAANQYLKNAVVIARLAEFRYAVLGEVLQPGSKFYPGARLTIFQAIASAGDVTYSGRRRDVVIIRQEEKGTRTLRVDLTDPSLVISLGLYIIPNDIIYVKPNFLRAVRVNISDYLLLVGSVTSTLPALLLILRL
jgi:polysaccharide export outer membrane protein